MQGAVKDLPGRPPKACRTKAYLFSNSELSAPIYLLFEVQEELGITILDLAFRSLGLV